MARVYPKEERPMIGLEELLVKINNLEERVAALESKPRKRPSSERRANDQRESLAEVVLRLREEDFFASPNIAGEVHKRLSDSYPCELNRVEVVLSRLARKKELRKVSKIVDGKKYVAYVW
jgi:hypothetical protein